MSSKQRKSALELPLSVIRPDQQNGAVSPVFTLIVTDHSHVENEPDKKYEKKKHRKPSKYSKSQEVS